MTKTPTSILPPRPQRHGGFTLVELMVSIGIIIFILSVTMVAFAPLIEGQRPQRRPPARSAGHSKAPASAPSSSTAASASKPSSRLGTEASTRQWCVTPNAGDQLHDLTKLPDFVAVDTTACGNSYAINANPPSFTRLGVTFGPDGSVVHTVLGYTPPGTTTGEHSPGCRSPSLGFLHPPRQHARDHRRQHVPLHHHHPLDRRLRHLRRNGGNLLKTGCRFSAFAERRSGLRRRHSVVGVRLQERGRFPPEGFTPSGG